MIFLHTTLNRDSRRFIIFQKCDISMKLGLTFLLTGVRLAILHIRTLVTVMTRERNNHASNRPVPFSTWIPPKTAPPTVLSLPHFPFDSRGILFRSQPHMALCMRRMHLDVAEFPVPCRRWPLYSLWKLPSIHRVFLTSSHWSLRWSPPFRKFGWSSRRGRGRGKNRIIGPSHNTILDKW
jgi:hypothetical protein